MDTGAAVWLGSLELELGVGSGSHPLGTRVLSGLVTMADRAIEGLRRTRVEQGMSIPPAVVSRLRGSGRGVSASGLFAQMERQHPIDLCSPFEGSHRVSGAVWHVGEILGRTTGTAVAKLRWDAGADDLPMHVHEHSDRFIIVASGRGYFHVTDESVEGFSGRRVRTVPARERDVFLFARGVVHTFSTESEPMTLLSCQSPYLPFDDPRQYRLPDTRWTAAQHQDDGPATVTCDAAWTMLCGSGQEGQMRGGLPLSCNLS